MNKSFKSVMNKSTGTNVAAGENAKSQGKSLKSKLATKLASASFALSTAVGLLTPIESFAQSVPYIGTESDGKDFCLKDASNLAACDPWSPGFTDVSGKRFAYMTSENGTTEGGLWAGNLSSGMFFGSGPAGMNRVVVDANGTTISGTTLTLKSANGIDVSSSKIKNVNAGAISAESMDAVNGSQLFALTDGSTVVNSTYMKATGKNDGTDNATASGVGSVAFGAKAYAVTTSQGEGATAIGFNAKAGGGGNPGATAIGANSVADQDGTAVGYGAIATTKHSVAIGVGSIVSSYDGVAIGNNAHTNKHGDIAMGVTASATGDGTDSAMALGANAEATLAGIAIGTGANASEKNSVALGGHSIADTANTVSVGSSTLKRKIVNVQAGDATSATSTDAVNGGQLFAINSNVTQNTTDIAQDKSDIASNIGNISKNTADIGTLNTQVGTIGTQIGSLNTQVGSLNTQIADAVRYDMSAHSLITLGGASGTKITNLADGSVLASSKDAVNGSQLYAVKQSIASQGSSLADVVAYDSAAHDVMTLTGTSGTTIKNVKAGDISATSTDAVNGSQLNTVAENVKQNTTDIASLNNSMSDFNNGFLGLSRQDALTRLISIGANTDGSSISVAGTQGARTLTGVAKGAVSADSTDAVNGAQLAQVSASTAAALGGGSGVDANGSVSAPTYSVGGTQVHDVGSAFDNIDGRVTQNSADIAGLKGNIMAASSAMNPKAVSYDSTDHNKVTLGGTAATDAVQLTNVKAGELSSASTDAVNGAQLNATNERVGVTETAIAGYEAAGLGFMTVNLSSASGSKPVALGQDAVAIGVNASAAARNSVALGANSIADQADTVSVGSAGNERRVTNVAAGVGATDAINMTQMNQFRSDVGASLTALQRAAFGGVAAAMTMTNATPSAPGKTTVGAGVANYKGYSAIGAGVTHRSASGRWIVNGAVSATQSGDAGVRARADYEF